MPRTYGGTVSSLQSADLHISRMYSKSCHGCICSVLGVVVVVLVSSPTQHKLHSITSTKHTHTQTPAGDLPPLPYYVTDATTRSALCIASRSRSERASTSNRTCNNLLQSPQIGHHDTNATAACLLLCVCPVYCVVHVLCGHVKAMMCCGGEGWDSTMLATRQWCNADRGTAGLEGHGDHVGAHGIQLFDLDRT